MTSGRFSSVDVMSNRHCLCFFLHYGNIGYGVWSLGDTKSNMFLSKCVAESDHTYHKKMVAGHSTAIGASILHAYKVWAM